MAILGTELADGQLPNTKTTLYTVPGGKTLYLTGMVIYNTNTTTEHVQIWLNRGTSRTVIDIDMATRDAAYWDGDHMVLTAGHTIEGATTTALKVDYVISGGIA